MCLMGHHILISCTKFVFLFKRVSPLSLLILGFEQWHAAQFLQAPSFQPLSAILRLYCISTGGSTPQLSITKWNSVQKSQGFCFQS